MEWLVWIGLLGLLTAQQISNHIWRNKIDTRLASLTWSLDQFRTRQNKIAMQKVSQKNPPVDSRARTTVRDTHDLKPTGRMSMGVHRGKVRFERTTDDN